MRPLGQRQSTVGRCLISCTFQLRPQTKTAFYMKLGGGLLEVVNEGQKLLETKPPLG